MKTVQLSEEVVNGILQYISRDPVIVLFGQMQSEIQAQVKPAEPPKQKLEIAPEEGEKS